MISLTWSSQFLLRTKEPLGDLKLASLKGAPQPGLSRAHGLLQGRLPCFSN